MHTYMADDFVRYAFKTVLINSGVLYSDNGAWIFKFKTPISGLENQNYVSQDRALDSLFTVLEKQHAQKAA